jgi:hypothetical protein
MTGSPDGTIEPDRHRQVTLDLALYRQEQLSQFSLEARVHRVKKKLKLGWGLEAATAPQGWGAFVSAYWPVNQVRVGVWKCVGGKTFGLLSQVFHCNVGIWRALKAVIRMRAARVGGHHRGFPRYCYNAGSAGLVDGVAYPLRRWGVGLLVQRL